MITINTDQGQKGSHPLQIGCKNMMSKHGPSQLVE
jgi:hypothetical protein